jgi:molybdenum cofactor cytidylyltransferase
LTLEPDGVIAGIVLAAGLSRRMGEPKLLLPIEGRPVVRIAVEGLLAAGLAPVVVVTGTEHQALAGALAGLPVALVNNPSPEAGQAGSIRVGIGALPPDTEAVLIALGDQPFLPPGVIAGLVSAFRATGKAIVAPRYREGRGNPVLFGRESFPELRAISGDQGARAVVERDPERVALVEIDLPMPLDVDTPEDYGRFRTPEHTV